MREAKQITSILDDINPIHNFNNINSVRNLFFQRKIAEAEKEALAYLDQFPTNRSAYFDLGRIYLLQNKNQKAVELYQLSLKNIGDFAPYTSNYSAIAYHRLGQMEAFEKIIQQFIDAYNENSSASPAYFLAAIYCNIGETDLGFEWLEKSFTAHDVEMTWLKMDPIFDPVKEDERYLNMLEKVGFSKNIKG